MSVKKLTDKLDFGPVFFVAPNPNRAVGLERRIKNYHIICSQYLDIVEYLREDGVPVLCLDDVAIKNTGKLLENDKVLNYIKAQSGGETPSIITFKPSPRIEKICELNEFNHIGNKWSLNRKFENKINFVEITGKLKIPNARSSVMILESFEAIGKYLGNGKKCVIQLPRGFSGNSTFLIGGKEDFDKVLKDYHGRSIKIAEYLAGETFTINGCVGGNDICVGKPIYQITGLTDFNGNELGTSGNDYAYPDKLGVDVREKIFNYTKMAGRYMKKEGYRGIFGLDFIVGKNGTVDLIEINPRLVGSVPVYTKLQIENNELPFLAIHIEEFLKRKNKNIHPAEQSFSFWQREKKFNASQLILRNVTKDPLEVEKAPASGIYEIKNGRLEFIKKSYCIGKMLRSDEILIQCAFRGTIVNPDMEYANIQVSYGIMRQDKLSDYFSKIVELVLNEIRLKNKV